MARTPSLSKEKMGARGEAAAGETPGVGVVRHVLPATLMGDAAANSVQFQFQFQFQFQLSNFPIVQFQFHPIGHLLQLPLRHAARLRRGHDGTCREGHTPPQEDPNTDYIMVATGTGIAPFCGFMRRLFLEETPASDVYKGQTWLFLGVTSSNALFYDDEF